ncbi:MAG: STAS domain-containing protein [Planctomycetaceae bacterium]
MAGQVKIFDIYKSGELTVLGFDQPERLDHVDVTKCRDELTGLIPKYRCKTLAFDLTKVKLLPSGLLGLLASLRKLGVAVHLYNPSNEVRSVLQITKLDQLMQVHDLNPLSRTAEPVRKNAAG